MISMAVLLLCAGLPEARFVTHVVTKSWEPLELSSVEALVEGAALPPLTGLGEFVLTKATDASLSEADYVLRVEGRFVEEAELFSVYLTFGPAKKLDFPSFAASETIGIGKLPRDVMVERIRDVSAKTAGRLAELLKSRAAAARLRVAAPPSDEPVFTWGPIEAPIVSDPNVAMKTLLNPRNPDHERSRALAEIGGQAFDQPAVKKTLQLCVLRDPSPEVRVRCAEALAPVARADVPTQRLLLHAMRNEVDDRVLSQLMELAQGFVGLSRKEAIETWLELVASEATPAGSASAIAKALAEEGDVPNLDLTVAKCLLLESLIYGKRQACAQWLLPVIPAGVREGAKRRDDSVPADSRRVAVVAPYLEAIRVFETGESNAFEDVSDAIGKGSVVDPAVAELFLRVAERPSAGHVRDNALFIAMKNERPSTRFIERVVALTAESTLASAAARALLDLASNAPDQREAIAGALERVLATHRWLAPKHGSDPRREILETVERLRRSRN